MATYPPTYHRQHSSSSSASYAAQQSKSSRPNLSGSSSWTGTATAPAYPNPNHYPHVPQPSSSASAAASAFSSSSSATIGHPSISVAPPYAGAPPLPAGANIPQAQWQAGFWQFNPAYKGRPTGGGGGGQQQQRHVPWIPSQQWMYRQQPPQAQQQQQQQQQQASFNPYKRVPRPPSAEYLATKLSDNPLGLSNMTPVSIEEYYRQGQPSPEPEPEHTPWIWKPSTLAPDDDADGADGHSQVADSTTTPQRNRSGSHPHPHTSSTPTQQNQNSNQPEAAFTSHLALKPTFSPKIVRTPDHYRSDSNPLRQGSGSSEQVRGSPTPLSRHSTAPASAFGSGSGSFSSSSLTSHGSLGSLGSSGSSGPSSAASFGSFWSNGSGGSGNASARSSLSSWSAAYSTEKEREKDADRNRQPKMLVASQMSDEPVSMEDDAAFTSRLAPPHNGRKSEERSRGGEWGKGKDTDVYTDPGNALLSPLVIATPMTRSLPAPSLGEVSSTMSEGLNSQGANPSSGGQGGRVRREHTNPVIASRSLDTIPEARREDWDAAYSSSRVKPAKTYPVPADDAAEQRTQQQQQRLGSRHTMYVDAYVPSPPAMVRSGSGTSMPSAAAMVRSSSGGGSGHGSPARSFEGGSGSGGAASARVSPYYVTPPSSNEASPIGHSPSHGRSHSSDHGHGHSQSPAQSHGRAAKEQSPRATNPLPPPPVPSPYIAPPVMVRSSSASAAAAAMASLSLGDKDRERERERERERDKEREKEKMSRRTSGRSSASASAHATPSSSHLAASAPPRHNNGSGTGTGTSPYGHPYPFSPPLSPSAPMPYDAQRPPRLRRGYWNRRGDHLTPDGYIVYAPPALAFPRELSTYPPEKEGYQDHEGSFCQWVQRPELRESLPREGRKAERPYESFVVYVNQ